MKAKTYLAGGRDYIIEKGWDKAHRGPIDLDKVHHINNSVDLENFRCNQETSTYTDKDLSDLDSFKVVYTGSIRTANQVHELVSVADILRSLGKNNIKRLIWGSGDQVDVINEMIKEKSQYEDIPRNQFCQLAVHALFD